MIDKTTKKWIRNAADERAARNGYFIDEARGDHFVEFVETHLKLYEGEYAGEPIQLMDWQIDMFYRLFSWVRFDETRGRNLRRFSIASIWLPKKSGKSPTAAMVGTYLLAADGMPGTHVYSCARDSKQARIVHKNACMMVQQSEALNQLCTINNSTGVIAYEPTHSDYSIIAGSNYKSLEGLNGHVIIDEVHVVDQRMASALEHAGISHPESLRLEISTAGNNQLGYGKHQWDYGESVNRGEVADDNFLFVKYAAPQDATDEELQDPKMWEMANPSMHRTVDPDEFEKSLHRAKRSLNDWANFKMYRFNIWSSSEQPWLKMDNWRNCEADFDASDLEGRECILGLDLSRTKDMSAASLVFDNGDGSATVLPYFWYPRNAARTNNHIVPYIQWATDGYIKLIPGDVINYNVIEADIIDLADRFNITQIVYDSTYAEDVTSRLEDETGIDRIAMPQTMKHFAAPTAEMERLVIDGKMHHNSNPVLNWQAQNVTIYSDNNNNNRPVKPHNSNPRKIDGIVATIMALGQMIAARDLEPKRDYYDDNKLEMY